LIDILLPTLTGEPDLSSEEKKRKKKSITKIGDTIILPELMLMQVVGWGLVGIFIQSF